MLIFVIVVALAGFAAVAASSFVGARRRAQGDRLDGQFKSFRRR
jgi:hypothetical protein